MGYDIVDDKYLINEYEAESVRLIFKMYMQGESYSKIIDKLNGATDKFGRPTGKNSINSILSNERYIGTFTWNKHVMRVMKKWAGGKPNPKCIRIENAIPKIIDNDTWERVREKMSNNKKSGLKAKREYLLTGLIECADCGATYVGHCSTNSRGYSTRYYVCGNKYRTRTCQSKNINADEVETFVVNQLKEYFKS